MVGSDPIAAETCCVALNRSLPLSGPPVLFCDLGVGVTSLDEVCQVRGLECYHHWDVLPTWGPG